MKAGNRCNTEDVPCELFHQEILKFFEEAQEFKAWSKDQIISIIPFVEKKVFDAGELIYRENDLISHVLFIKAGVVITGDTQSYTQNDALGLECVLGYENYNNQAQAETEVELYSLPIKMLPKVERDSAYKAGRATDSNLFQTLYGRCGAGRRGVSEASDQSSYEGGEHQPETFLNQPETTVNSTHQNGSLKAYLGWLAVIVLPAGVYLLGIKFELPWPQNYYLTALCACMILLILELVPQYAAVLVTALACLLLDIAPVDVVLSGFSSGGFFMALSIYGLGSVLLRSGLATRLVLMMLKYSPRTRFWHNFSVLMSGIIMTPCLPSANARVSLMTPLIQNVSRAVGYRDGSREATQMMLSMFVGASIFAPIFLTGKSLNFVLYSMLPQQVSEEYQWLNWLYSASFAGLVMLVLYLLVSSFFFRKGREPELSKQHFRAQIDMKGAMARVEWVALLSIVVFILAITTYSFHKISLFWVAFGFFSLSLVMGTLKDQNVNHDIEWDTLLLIGFFIGLENALDFTGISELITGSLSGVTSALNGSFYLFITLTIVLVSVLRLFLPITTAGVLAASVCLPLAKINGLDSWVACFVILMSTECWVWPKQCSYYGAYKGASVGLSIEDERLFHRMNIFTVAIRIASIYLLAFYFQWLGQL